MTVTNTVREKGHLVRVELGQDSVLLDLDVFTQHCIHTGDELSPEQIEEYKRQSDYVRAKSRALWLLDRYSYSRRRLSEKLTNSGFEQTAVSAAIARLEELGVVNDNTLCRNYAEDCRRRGISKREAYAKLLSKGFSRDTVKSALDSAEFDEASQLKELISRKYRQKLLSGDTDKVYAALVRKGFSFGAVRDALKKYSRELEYEEDN